jgi:hypothetical protein
MIRNFRPLKLESLKKSSGELAPSIKIRCATAKKGA